MDYDIFSWIIRKENMRILERENNYLIYMVMIIIIQIIFIIMFVKAIDTKMEYIVVNTMNIILNNI